MTTTSESASECCRHSLSCGGAILRIADGGKGICQNCANTIGNLQLGMRHDVKKAAQNELHQKEDEIKCRVIVAYEEGLAAHTENEKKAVEKARKEWETEKWPKCTGCGGEQVHAVLCEACADEHDKEVKEDALTKLNASLEQTYREAKSQLVIPNKRKREAIADYMRGIEEAQRQVKAQTEE